MSAPKFTPGPWVIGTGADKTPLIHAEGSNVGLATVEWVRCTQTRYANVDATNANARLIAAAPELYAALARIVDGDNSEAAYHQAMDALAGLVEVAA